ncbi:MAG: hypothetical protein SOW45_07650 [Prevotella sp.]|nr:hypothetical protein [Prevotella sp.]
MTDVPDNFKAWAKNNADRISKAEARGKLPYFIRDNVRSVDKILGTNMETTIIGKEIKEVMITAKSVANEVQSLAERVAKRHGAVTTPINLKSEASIMRKVLSERERLQSFSAKDLKDTVRTTIISEMKDIESIIQELANEPNITAVKRQTAEKYFGYTGTIINLRTSKWIIGEIQVNTPRMIYAKEKPEIAKAILGEKVWNQIEREVKLPGGLGHELYEKMRILDKETAEWLAIRDMSIEYYQHFQN